MPTINTNIDTDIDVDIEIDEFIESCSYEEIQEVIDYLKEYNYLTPSQDLSKQNVTEYYWNLTMSKLTDNRLLLTDEETELIEKIAKRF